MSPRQHRRPGETSPLAPPTLKASTETLSVGDQPRGQKTGGGSAANRREGRTPFSSYLPADLQRQFKAQCAMHDIEMQQGLEEAVRLWLNRNAY